ncbi:hypothetical protein AVEN_35133-1 [Araneus ventricosus]|uniref:Uncharacterized protein n=1 Tax=Araneus ventricosus TaxID=182803 RepID=A0A4Y2PT89_ARAVE|nr:hypothetical protein AVEN_4166-1 [Araneus ventricosus]GBN54547.1 hypothetical protein AVEN_35133-1 [Araneus ventricosus]
MPKPLNDNESLVAEIRHTTGTVKKLWWLRADIRLEQLKSFGGGEQTYDWNSKKALVAEIRHTTGTVKRLWWLRADIRLERLKGLVDESGYST